MKNWFGISFIILFTLGIFFFSFQDAETSTTLSVSITQKIVGETDITPSQSVLSLNHLIRELAHILEFFLLSFVTLITLSTRGYRFTQCMSWTTLYIFTVSILDELIQYSFSSGRAFQFIDLLKDWFGMGLALISFSILYKLYRILCR